MAIRINNTVPQHFDKATNAPLAGGQLFFFEPGGATTKPTFSNADESTANANPVILDGSGFEPNIFGTGSYRIVLRASPIAPAIIGVQQWARDPVNVQPETGAFGIWSPSTSYLQNDIVKGSDGNFYVSLTGTANLDKDPTLLVNASFWTQFDLLNRWNAAETYGINDVVRSGDGIVYTSRTTPNLNNNPDTESPAGVNWKMFDNIRIDGNTISATNLNGDVIITAAGAGDINNIVNTGDINNVLNTGDVNTTTNSGNINNVCTTGNIVSVAPASDISNSAVNVTSTASTGNVNAISTTGDVNSSGANVTSTASTGNVNAVATVGNVNITATAGTVALSDPTTVGGQPVGLAQVTAQSFTSDGTWTKPANVKFLIIECVGGGGGGGGCPALINIGGGGGGAGGYIRHYFDVSAPSLTSLAIVIGAGGLVTTGADGATGTATTVIGTGINLNAGPGGGGIRGGAFGVAANQNGGVSTGGNINIFGGDGHPQSGSLLGTPNPPVGLAGNGGSSYFGGGAAGSAVINTSVAGRAGQVFGSGGSGGATGAVPGNAQNPGGIGAAGFVIITEYR